jgi:hypothetical protein
MVVIFVKDRPSCIPPPSNLHPPTFKGVAPAGVSTNATNAGIESTSLVWSLFILQSQFPHKAVNKFFISVILRDKLTDLRGS